MTDNEHTTRKMAMAALSGAMRGTWDRNFGVLAGDVRWSWAVIEEDVPALLAEVERLRAENAALRSGWSKIYMAMRPWTWPVFPEELHAAIRALDATVPTTERPEPESEDARSGTP